METGIWDRAQAAFVGKFPNNTFWRKSGADRSLIQLLCALRRQTKE